MAAKKSNTPSSDDKREEDINKVEERVKKMLDPSEPPEQQDSTAGEPSTAPEVSKVDDELELPREIKISGEDEKNDTQAEKVPKQIAVSEHASSENEDAVKNNETELTIADETSQSAVESEEAEQPEGLGESVDQQGLDVADEAANEDDTGEKVEDRAVAAADESDDTDKAVDEIVAAESDELLKAEDEKRAKLSEPIKKPSILERIKHLPSAWWHSRRAKRITLILFLVVLFVVMTVPVSRYFMLNTVGVRSGASIQILDDSTQQPLKNVSVSMRGQTVQTNSDGEAKFTDLKLGQTELLIEKRAFAVLRKSVTLGWGSNPLGNASLTPVGSQYSFRVIDFLSGRPLGKVEAVSADASAFSDDNGLIKLTVDKTDDLPVNVSLTGAGLRTEKFSIDANDTSVREVIMVPGRKHVFISKRSGKFDVYKIDVDAKNEEIVVPGSGHERSDMMLAPHPEKEFAALVSTRTGARNGHGYLLSTLLLIDLSDNSTVEVALSERVQILGWIDNKLIYVRIAAGSSATNPSRHRLMTYDLESFESNELASSNYFNDILIAKKRVFYAPSSAYETKPTALFSVKADGTDKRKITDKEVWSLFRTAYNTLTMAIVGQEWHELNLDNGHITKLGGEPANLRNRIYTESPDGKKSLWIDERDGKSALLVHDNESNQDSEVLFLSGMKAPLRWLDNNNLIYRLATSQETADYALSINGKEPKKIRDVTDTPGIDSWYYH